MVHNHVHMRARQNTLISTPFRAAPLPMPGGGLRAGREPARHERRLEDVLDDEPGESSFLKHVEPAEREQRTYGTFLSRLTRPRECR